MLRGKSTGGVAEFLQELIRIPSVNPDLVSGAKEGGESRMADFLAGHLDGLGMAVERHELIAGRPNVVGSFGPSKPRRSVLIESHLDTQGVHGMTVPPFEAVRKDGRVYGRGACDTKGPMAAALIALTRERLESLASAGVRLTYVGAVGEERGNVGAEQLVEQGLGADEALVLEPTDLHIVHAHKGALWIEVELRGLAAHGSNPDAGKSAVVAMAKLIPEIDRATRARAGRIHHDLLGGPTVNFGLLQGGTSINIVPDQCLLQVDRRTLPGEDNEEIVAEISAAAERLKQAGDITGYEVRCLKSGRPFATTADCRLIERLAAACRKRGVEAVKEGAPWFSDAGPFSRTCAAVAVFGPGSIRQAHTSDEFIDIAELEKGAAILGDFFDAIAAET